MAVARYKVIALGEGEHSGLTYLTFLRSLLGSVMFTDFLKACYSEYYPDDCETHILQSQSKRRFSLGMLQISVDHASDPKTISKK